MSRTCKGARPPGWEPGYSNRDAKAEQRAAYREPERDWQEDECQGCRYCLCVFCGGPVVVQPLPADEDAIDITTACMTCGAAPPEEEP